MSSVQHHFVVISASVRSPASHDGTPNPSVDTSTSNHLRVIIYDIFAIIYPPSILRSIHHGKKKQKKKQFTIRFTIDSRRFTSMHHSIHHAIHRSIRLNPHVQQMTPAICQASFSFCAQVGETSDGLSTTQFPAAMAAMQGAKDRWKGKFQAPRTKTT